MQAALLGCGRQKHQNTPSSDTFALAVQKEKNRRRSYRSQEETSLSQTPSISPNNRKLSITPVSQDPLSRHSSRRSSRLPSIHIECAEIIRNSFKEIAELTGHRESENEKEDDLSVQLEIRDPLQYEPATRPGLTVLRVPRFYIEMSSVQQAALTVCWARIAEHSRRKQTMKLLCSVFDRLFERFPKCPEVMCGAFFTKGMVAYHRATEVRLHAERLFHLFSACVDWLNASKHEEHPARLKLHHLFIAYGACHAPLSRCHFKVEAFELFGQCLVDKMLENEVIQQNPASKVGWLMLFALVTDRLRHHYEYATKKRPQSVNVMQRSVTNTSISSSLSGIRLPSANGDKLSPNRASRLRRFGRQLSDVIVEKSRKKRSRTAPSRSMTNPDLKFDQLFAASELERATDQNDTTETSSKETTEKSFSTTSVSAAVTETDPEEKHETDEHETLL